MDSNFPHNPPQEFIDRGKQLVYDYALEHLDKTDPVPDFKAFVVTFTKTLQNWKGMFSTTLPDKMYYEVTYDGENGCTYLDAYIKIDNRKIMDEE